MKSLVVMTYYQLMHSIAMALTFDEKPNLYFSMSYLNLDDEVLERIEHTGVFNKVIGITRRMEHKQFLKELRKTIDMDDEQLDELGSSLFDKYLIPHYEKLFVDADPNDEIFVYNDFQWHYYYICKRFENIVGVEDGYGSLLQQVSVHRLRGDAALIEPFVERGYYPEPLYRFENVKKIISSIEIDELDDYYKSKLIVKDFKELVDENAEAFKKALLYIFKVDELNIQDNSSLIIGQPLDRAKFCTYFQSYLLNKKIIRQEVKGGHHVYLKPHPAEKNNWMIYENENVTVLPKDFPIEVLNYQNKTFARVVTFSSTGASIVSCGEEYYRYFDKTDTTPKEVKRFIKDEISTEKIAVDFYLMVKDMTPETFINVYSYIFNTKFYKTNIHLLITDDNLEEYKSFYDRKNLDQMVSEYKKSKKGTKEHDLWHLELGRITLWLERYHPHIDVCKVSSFDEWDIFREVISNNTSYDYIMLLDSKNNGFSLIDKIRDSLDRHMHVGICFQNYTEKVTTKNRSKKVSVKPGFVGREYSGELINKLLHRALIERYKKQYTPEEYGDLTFARTIRSCAENVGRKQGVSLYIDPEKYLAIKNGKEYFSGKIRTIIDAFADSKADEEFMVGQLAHVVYDYYDWSIIADAETFADTAIEELKEVFAQERDIELKVYRMLTGSLMYEKALSDNNKLFQEKDFYTGMKAVVDKAAKGGTLRRVDNANRVKKKLKKILKKIGIK